SEHSRRFVPNDAQLLVVGDLTLIALKKMLKSYFTSWKKSKKSISIVSDMDFDFKNEKVFVEMDTPQLNIRIGHKSLKISNPDYFPLLIADYILGGGGFNSRLMQRVRTEMGLAYSIYSYIWGDVYYGTMGVYCGTKTSGAIDAMSEIFSQIERIRDQKVSQEEFDLAKNSMVNQYVFKFSSKYQVVSRMLYFERKNLREDYMQYYLDSLKKVTIEDVQEASKKYWKPESLKVLVVGQVSTIKSDLEKKFGKFKEVKLEKVQ
ncbi:insulinase family protein, partial [bacterium]|nr:insulinase family protein [bacterium]